MYNCTLYMLPMGIHKAPVTGVMKQLFRFRCVRVCFPGPCVATFQCGFTGRAPCDESSGLPNLWLTFAVKFFPALGVTGCEKHHGFTKWRFPRMGVPEIIHFNRIFHDKL